MILDTSHKLTTTVVDPRSTRKFMGLRLVPSSLVLSLLHAEQPAGRFPFSLPERASANAADPKGIVT